MAVAGIIVFVCIVAWLIAPREPVCDGRPLSYWVVRLGGDLGAEQTHARKALERAGPKAVPTLLRMLGAHDQAWKTMLFKLLQKQHVVTISHMDPSLLAVGAGEGFRVIGSNGISAVPRVIKIFNANYTPASQAAAARALGGFGTNAMAAVPSLLGVAASTNSVRTIAITTLGEIHADPGRVVPVLINMMADPLPWIQERSLGALGEFGPDARGAVPVLVALIKKERSRGFGSANPLSPNSNKGPTLEGAAWEALQKIDPTEYDRLRIELHLGHILN